MNATPNPAYDRIAHLYDIDMARNMRFDDVGFYARTCAMHGGRALEIGCGNGRVLLELLARGVDAYGVDAAANMLAELAAKAAQRGLPLRAGRMDARRLAVGRAFDVVVCPYSLITYMPTEDDARALLSEARRVLGSRGILVVDAFVPRPVASGLGFVRDYLRPFGAGQLIRSKRVTAVDARINRIERRYEIMTAEGRVAETIETCEEIRTYAPGQLLALLEAAGLVARDQVWNYGTGDSRAEAQFFTVVASVG